MHQILINDETHYYNTFEECLINFNLFLSNCSSTNKLELLTNYENLLTIKINDKVIRLITNKILVNTDLILLKYFLFTKNTIDYLNNSNNIFFDKLSKLDPYTLIDVFAYDCLIDPYHILKNIYKINEDYIYQTFILYLNKTIKLNDVMTKFDSNEIIINFFKNKNYPKKYNELLLFYLKQTNIYPFMIKFNKYDSCINSIIKL